MIYQLINVGVSLAQNDHFSAKKRTLPRQYPKILWMVVKSTSW
jgi:hypothetical protein